MEQMFDLTNGIQEDVKPECDSIIRVIGVGGAGNNAVNTMYEIGIEGVNYINCNTDAKSLEYSNVPIKIQLGKKLTGGLGAGSKPERGEQSAIEDMDEIVEVLKGAKMVFVTAGMGGGTGTGAAPVIAAKAKELGILTIGVVSIPYKSEGNKRIRQAIRGIEKMEKSVDSLLIVNSERLVDMYGELPLSKAMSNGDNTLAMSAKSLAEVITKYGRVNVDFADVDTAMRDSGVALIGSATAAGPNRAYEAVTNALNSPLLNNNKIKGSKHIIVNLTSSDEFEVTQNEQAFITNYLREEAGFKDDDDEDEEDALKWGSVRDDSLGENLRVTVIATGFSSEAITSKPKEEPVKVVVDQGGNIINDDDDTANARTIDLTPEKKPNEYTDKINILYDKDGYTNDLEQQTSNSIKLADPIVRSMDDLRFDEVLREIEETPAFERRKIKE